MIDDVEHSQSWLVAHRGDRLGGVENTLAAFACARDAGACYAECDIQFTRDLVAVVMHDNRLNRLCALAGIKVADTDFLALTSLCAPHFELLTLENLLLWLEKQPQLTMFVEIKPSILRRLSVQSTLRRLASLIHPAHQAQLVLISQSVAIIDRCKPLINCRTGWVALGQRLPESKIDYVFMAQDNVEKMKGWQQQGIKVGLYTVNDPVQAEHLRKLGADLIETDHYSKLVVALG